MRKAILALAICVGLAASPAIPARSPRGAEVGFWASQTLQPCEASTDPAYCPRDLSSYTPEVWDALATGHGSLFLNLVYGSDFGPAPAGKTQRTDGLALVREANRRGIIVNAWVTAPFDGGTFANENNASLMAAAIRAMHDWAIEKALQINEVVLDNEFPLGVQPVAELLAGDPSGLRPNIDPSHQCEAIATYRDAINWAHRQGMRVTGAPVPFALDDLFDRSLALQDALDITAFPPLNYDTWYLQAYRSYDNVGAGYVSGYYRDMQRFFGARGQITIGDVNLGTPPYDDLANLVRDVRMLAGLGATTIPVYDLDGTVRSFGVDGVRAVIEAGRQPLTGAELAAASQTDPQTELQRTFFRTLDVAATALTTVATVGRGPNAYPNGCGRS